MSWSWFIYFAVAALLLWWGGAVCALRGRRKAAVALTAAGLLVFGSFIAGMWVELQRPVLRTMGETRLWYAFLLPVVGLVTYIRQHYRWIPTFATVMATVFTLINILKPEIHSAALVPALQSPWFAPHVIVYMFAYATLGASFVMAVYLLWIKRDAVTFKEILLCDNLVRVGVSFMTFGMLFGALWANQAWGHYWTWDPKETWAAATWLLYLCYLHFRRVPRKSASDDGYGYEYELFLLVLAFLCLQICWWGINYLPSAQGASVHTY